MKVLVKVYRVGGPLIDVFDSTESFDKWYEEHLHEMQKFLIVIGGDINQEVMNSICSFLQTSRIRIN